MIEEEGFERIDGNSFLETMPDGILALRSYGGGPSQRAEDYFIARVQEQKDLVVNAMLGRERE